MAKNGEEPGRQIYEGQWWVPDDENGRILGELFLGREQGLHLRLKIPEGYASIGDRPIKVIHGLDQHGKPITLFQSHCSNQVQSGALTIFTYSVGFCFHGAHFLRWAEARFNEADAQFTFLQDWMNISGFIPEKAEDGEAVLHYRLPEDLEFDSGHGFVLKLFATVSTHGERQDFRSIRQSWTLRLKYRQAQPFKRIRRDLRIVRRLLTLGVKRSVDQLTFTVSRSDDDQWLGGKRLRCDIKCYTPETRDELDDDRKHAAWMLFAFTDVRSEFGTILNRWFDYHEQLDDALNLYFSTVENQHLYSNHVFLFLAQALEVYHRSQPTKFAQAIESKAEFRKRLARLTKDANKADAKWLRAALAFANAPTLNTRLLEIFREKKPILGDFIENEKEFTDLIRRTRNHFTHWSEKTKKLGRIADDDDLFDLSYRLKVILQVCFLSDIGVPERIVKKLLAVPKWTVVSFDEEDDVDVSGPQTPQLRLTAPKKRKKAKRR